MNPSELYKLIADAELTTATNPIYVSRPTLPDLNQYTALLQEIWDSKWLTNSGKFHKDLETQLIDFLGVPQLSLTANGTLSILLALKATGFENGSVITTPFTFPATVHCLTWLGLRPIFADVDPKTGNISPESVAKLIEKDTVGILAVHVYGIPCDHESLTNICNLHKLKLVYDAAHAFGVTINGSSILSWGDASSISFHATKLFSTVEGGAIVLPSLERKQYVDRLKNFGIVNEDLVEEVGINAKMNELQAAFGILRLKKINDELTHREAISCIYDNAFSGVEGIHTPTKNVLFKRNNAYYPIVIDSDLFGMNRDSLYDLLKVLNVFPRKYFYPLCSRSPIYRGLPSAQIDNLPVANALESSVLCLPIYGTLKLHESEFVANTIVKLGQFFKKANRI